MPKPYRILLAAAQLLVWADDASAKANCPPPVKLATLPAQITNLIGNKRSGYLNEGSPDQPIELHIVSSYEGSGYVQVRASDKPIVLVLASYDPSLWHLDVAPDAHLQDVILLGPDERVIGVPPGANVLDFRGCASPASEWEGRIKDLRYMLDVYKEMLAVAQSVTGSVESSFQGAYDIGSKFTVPPSTADYQGTETIAAPDKPRQKDPPSLDELIGIYEAAAAAAPPEAKSTMQVIVDLIRLGKLPGVMPDSDHDDDPRAPRPWRQFFTASNGKPFKVAKTSECHTGFVPGIIVGSKLADRIDCAWDNQLIVGWAGEDVISDSWGDDIVNPGPGDDVIDLGRGYDILVLEGNWGNDVVSKDCGGVPAANRPRGYKPNHSSSIVFGPGISPADLAWESENMLVHSPSGGQLVLADDCFNLVFTEGGELAPYVEPSEAKP